MLRISPYICPDLFRRLRRVIVLVLIAASSLNVAGVTVGAERLDCYLHKLKGKRVALYTNQTGRIGDRATVDVLLDNGVDVAVLFSPEHGIRGTADAGEHVASGVDSATGIEVVSLFGGKYREKMHKAVEDVDLIVTDIQDVGLRYYTYYCTMLELMNEAARVGKQFMILDRPNPLGMTVDGPVLDMKYASGVGRLPIPTVHGLTLGEMGLMINGEGWLKEGRRVDLDVISCEGYTHATRYELPVAPSPNLPVMKAVYLYPSLCYFEATPVSLGRGTEMPFQIYGHPAMKGCDFSFTPQSRPGAKNPPLKGVKCHGVDLRNLDDEEIIDRGINLEYLIDAYNRMDRPTDFFTPFFEKLMGNGEVRKMIEQGKSASEIKATWADDIARFRRQRTPYLLYPEE